MAYWILDYLICHIFSFNHPEKKQNINILQLYYPVLILPEYKALYDYVFEKFSDDDMNKLDLLLKKTA